MKKHSTLLVVFFTVLFVLLLTWLLPITYLNGEFVSGERVQAGLNELFTYPVYTFYNFIYVLVYLLAVGGLYGVLHKTGAYRLLLDKIVKIIKGKEILFFIVTVLLTTVIVSFTGFTLEYLVFMPFIAGVIFLLGYDKITVALTTIGSVSIGVIGTTFSSLIAGSLSSMLSTGYKDLLLVKFVLLVVCSIILIVNIILHTRKVEKNAKIQESIFVPEKTSAKVKVWPLVVALVAFVLIFVMSTIAWEDAFGITFFADTLKKVVELRVLGKYVVLVVSLAVVAYNVVASLLRKKKNKKVEAKKTVGMMSLKRFIVTMVFACLAFVVLLKVFLEDIFGVTTIFTKVLELVKLDTIIDNFTFGKILGAVQSFGLWTYNEYVVLTLVLAIVLKFVYRVKISEAVEEYGNGAKKFLYAAIVVLLAYTVLIMTSNHPVMLTILKPLLTLTDGLNNVTLALSTLVSALFNTDFTYYEYGVLTLSYVSNYITDIDVYPLCVLITQSMHGLAILLAPTSAVMLFCLTTLKIGYLEWLKKIWKLFVELLVVLIITFTIVLLLI